MCRRERCPRLRGLEGKPLGHLMVRAVGVRAGVVNVPRCGGVLVVDAKDANCRHRCLIEALRAVDGVVATEVTEGGAEAGVVGARGADEVGERDRVEDRHLIRVRVRASVRVRIRRRA